MSYRYNRKKTYRRLNRAFHLMRKRGLLAKANFLCCSNCAGTEITNIAEKLIASKKRTKESITGCCFYHNQDNEIIDSYLGRTNGWGGYMRGGEFPKQNALHLRYGGLDSVDYDQIGLSMKEVGIIVCECLMEAGVGHYWNGSGASTIQVEVASACEHWEAEEVEMELLTHPDSPKELTA